MKRVAIDLRILHYARTGFFRYAQGMLDALGMADLDFAPLLIHLPGQDLSELNGRDWECLPTEVALFSPDEEAGLSDLFERHPVDAAHFPFSLFPGRVAPRVMLTIHDLTAERWPETIEGAYLPYYEAALARAGEADRVLFDSESVRREYERSRPLARASVAPPYTPFEGHGIDRVEGGETKRDRPFVLVVGSLEPRKDPMLALRSWELLRDRGADGPGIVFVAGHEWLSQDFQAAIDASRWKRDIAIRTDVDDAGLIDLLRGCSALLSMSRHEGFGLTVVEGAWAKAPVVSTPVPALTEAGIAQEMLLPPEPAAGLVAARLAELIADPAAAAAHADRMHAALAAHYGGLDSARLPQAYADLLAGGTDLPR